MINRKANIAIASFFWGIEILIYSLIIISYCLMLLNTPISKDWNTIGFIIWPILMLPSLLSGIATALYFEKKINDFWNTAFISSIAILLSGVFSFFFLLLIKYLPPPLEIIILIFPVIFPVMLTILIEKRFCSN